MENENIKKEILIEIFKKLGAKCISCGKFFIGAVVEASTENGNYGIYFDGISDYPLSCGKCPECAMECYKKLFDYVKEHKKVPCDNIREVEQELESVSDSNAKLVSSLIPVKILSTDNFIIIIK